MAWCVGVLCGMCAGAGGIEAGVIFALRAATKHRTEAQIEYYPPVVLMGALSAFLLCAGVARHYVDIYRERTVRGISFLFCFIDALGDLTSLLGVVFWWKAGRRLDVLGLVVYGSELVLWLGVFVCGGWLNLRPWLRRWVEVRRRRAGTGEGDEPVTVQGGDEHDGYRAAVGAVGRTSSTSASIVSSISFASGTVFRTASGRPVGGTEVEAENEHNVGHDALRLRSIVQV